MDTSTLQQINQIIEQALHQGVFAGRKRWGHGRFGYRAAKLAFLGGLPSSSRFWDYCVNLRKFIPFLHHARTQISVPRFPLRAVYIVFCGLQRRNHHATSLGFSPHRVPRFYGSQTVCKQYLPLYFRLSGFWGSIARQGRLLLGGHPLPALQLQVAYLAPRQNGTKRRTFFV